LFAACVDESFDDGQFLCDPQAGSDECPSEMVCGNDGRCAHQPSGGGGTTGTGGSSPDGCVALTCDDVGNQCGAISNGCGKLISCDCELPLTCGGEGVTGECGCAPVKSVTHSPGVLYTDGTFGDVDWSNADAGGKSSDEEWAIATLAAGEATHWLKANGFGFALPTGAVVVGVELAVERSKESGAGTVKDATVRVLVAGLPLPLDAKSGSAWPARDAIASYGGATELWGATAITEAEVAAPAFGVAIAAAASDGAATPRVDHVQLTVHYEDPACAGDGG
jgi:hypothetical protein